MDKEELARRAEEFGQRYTRESNFDGVEYDYSGFVDEVTEVLNNGEPTGMYFLTWISTGYGIRDARFAYKNCEDYSIDLPGEYYDKICDDPKKVLNAMHLCLVEYVASGECPIDLVPDEVKALFPDLETEIAEEEARQAAGEDTLKKMINDDELE